MANSNQSLSVEDMRIELMRNELLARDRAINPFKYIDLMPHQRKYFYEDEMLLKNAIFGGNQSSKTFSTAYFLVDEMRKWGCLIWANTWRRMSVEVQQATIYALIPKNGEFEYYWSDALGFRHNMIKHRKTGAVMMFRTYDQGRQKQQGGRVNYIWDDEEPPKPIWDEQKARVIARGGKLLLSMTPLNGLTHIYDEFIANKDENTRWVQWKSRDNRYIDGKTLEGVLASYDEKQALTRSTGAFINLNSGVVYYAFDPIESVIEEYDRNTKCTKDGKFRYDPTAILKLSCDFNVGLMSWNICQEHNGIDYVFDYIELEDYANTALMCQKFNLIYGNHPKHLLYVYPDRTGEARHTDAARSNLEIISQELKINHNTQIKSSVIKNKMDRVAATNARFYNSGKQRQLFICKNMKRLISDLQRVTWEHLDRMRLKDEDRLLTHASDALSYQIYYEHPLIPLPTTTIRYK
jgi:phage terminase large subunit-like protein